MKKLLRFLRDEKAAEVTELGIMLALIVALAVPIMVFIGVKVKAAYVVTNNALP